MGGKSGEGVGSIGVPTLSGSGRTLSFFSPVFSGCIFPVSFPSRLKIIASSRNIVTAHSANLNHAFWGYFLRKKTPPNKSAYAGTSHHALKAGMERAAKGNAAKRCATPIMYERSAYAGKATPTAKGPRAMPASAAKRERSIAHGTAASTRRFAKSE